MSVEKLNLFSKEKHIQKVISGLGDKNLMEKYDFIIDTIVKNIQKEKEQFKEYDQKRKELDLLKKQTVDQKSAKEKKIQDQINDIDNKVKELRDTIQSLLEEKKELRESKNNVKEEFKEIVSKRKNDFEHARENVKRIKTVIDVKKDEFEKQVKHLLGKNLYMVINAKPERKSPTGKLDLPKKDLPKKDLPKEESPSPRHSVAGKRVEDFQSESDQSPESSIDDLDISDNDC